MDEDGLREFLMEIANNGPLIEARMEDIEVLLSDGLVEKLSPVSIATGHGGNRTNFSWLVSSPSRQFSLRLTNRGKSRLAELTTGYGTSVERDHASP